MPLLFVDGRDPGPPGRLPIGGKGGPFGIIGGMDIAAWGEEFTGNENCPGPAPGIE